MSRQAKELVNWLNLCRFARHKIHGCRRVTQSTLPPYFVWQYRHVSKVKTLYLQQNNLACSQIYMSMCSQYTALTSLYRILLEKTSMGRIILHNLRVQKSSLNAGYISFSCWCTKLDIPIYSLWWRETHKLTVAEHIATSTYIYSYIMYLKGNKCLEHVFLW